MPFAVLGAGNTKWKKEEEVRNLHLQNTCSVRQGSPTPGPVRNQAAQQEVSGRPGSKASRAAPHLSHYCLNHTAPPPSVENCLPRNQSLVPKRLGTSGVRNV